MKPLQTDSPRDNWQHRDKKSDDRYFHQNNRRLFRFAKPIWLRSVFDDAKFFFAFRTVPGGTLADRNTATAKAARIIWRRTYQSIQNRHNVLPGPARRTAWLG